MKDGLTKNRPPKVSNAVTLLWAFIFIAAVVAFFRILNLPEEIPSGFIVSVEIISLGVIAFFIFMIGKGKNWARIVFLILFILDVPLSILSISFQSLILILLEVGGGCPGISCTYFIV